MQTVVETPTYLKAASTLFSEDEQTEIVSAIAFDPEAGDLMAALAATANAGSPVPEWENAAAPASSTCMAARTIRFSS